MVQTLNTLCQFQGSSSRIMSILVAFHNWCSCIQNICSSSWIIWIVAALLLHVDEKVIPPRTNQGCFSQWVGHWWSGYGPRPCKLFETGWRNDGGRGVNNMYFPVWRQTGRSLGEQLECVPVVVTVAIHFGISPYATLVGDTIVTTQQAEQLEGTEGTGRAL